MPSFHTIFRCLMTIPKVITLKIFRGNRVEFKGIQCYGRRNSFTIGKNAKCSFGEKIVTEDNVAVTSFGELCIGNKTFINQNTTITCMGKIDIGERCIIANNVVIVDHDHDYRNDNTKIVVSPIKIGKNVWIGANCVILKGVTIGDNVVIGAGTVVRKDIPNNMLYYELREGKYKKIEIEAHSLPK